MPISCVGSTGAGGADEPQALTTRLNMSKRTLVTKIRDLVYVFMVLLEVARQYLSRDLSGIAFWLFRFYK
jgi:hypothetical protein